MYHQTTLCFLQKYMYSAERFPGHRQAAVEYIRDQRFTIKPNFLNYYRPYMNSRPNKTGWPTTEQKAK